MTQKNVTPSNVKQGDWVLVTLSAPGYVHLSDYAAEVIAIDGIRAIVSPIGGLPTLFIPFDKMDGTLIKLIHASKEEVRSCACIVKDTLEEEIKASKNVISENEKKIRNLEKLLK